MWICQCKTSCNTIWLHHKQYLLHYTQTAEWNINAMSKGTSVDKLYYLIYSHKSRNVNTTNFPYQCAKKDISRIETTMDNLWQYCSADNFHSIQVLMPIPWYRLKPRYNDWCHVIVFHVCHCRNICSLCIFEMSSNTIAKSGQLKAFVNNELTDSGIHFSIISPSIPQASGFSQTQNRAFVSVSDLLRLEDTSVVLSEYILD